jgi:hypothetical protein
MTHVISCVAYCHVAAIVTSLSATSFASGSAYCFFAGVGGGRQAKPQAQNRQSKPQLNPKPLNLNLQLTPPQVQVQAAGGSGAARPPPSSRDTPPAPPKGGGKGGVMLSRAAAARDPPAVASLDTTTSDVLWGLQVLRLLALLVHKYKY